MRDPRLMIRPRTAAALAFVVGILMSHAAAASSLVDAVRGIESGQCPPALDTGSLEAALVSAHAARCWVHADQLSMGMAWVRAIDQGPHGAAVREGVAWFDEWAARAALHAGEHAEAERRLRVLVEQARDTRVSRGVDARIHYYLALAIEAQGRVEEANERYDALVERWPSSGYASRVAPRLATRDWTPESALAAGHRALEGRHYEAAEALYTLAACDGPPCSPRQAVASGDAARAEAAYQLGWFLYRFRREHVARALPWLETVAATRTPRQADAAYAYSLAVQRMRRPAEERRAWDHFAQRHPEHDDADEVAERRAWSLMEEHRFRDAREAWRRARREGDVPPSDAAWWAGWSAFRSGDCDAALRDWQDIGVGAAAQRVRYWRARCLALGGDTPAAHAAWRAVHSEAPFSWYGVLAAQRLEDLPVAASSRPSPSFLPNRAPHFAAARAGLLSEATVLHRDAGAPPLDPRGTLELLAQPMDWVRWYNALDDLEHRVPQTRAELERWQFAAPDFYRDVVFEQAEANGLPPELVWAVMQKESSYRRTAIPVSDAMGLMQVIPQTALAIAARLGVPYADGELFEPRTAVRYGAWYLGALHRSFGEQWPVTIAAYNAGPVAVRAWLERADGLPLDVFVEEMPFEQAREYVKRVTAIGVQYAIAHGPQERLASRTLQGWLPEHVAYRWTAEVTF